jgi:hypothetical protein
MAKALKSPSKVVSAQASKGSKKNSDCSANGCQAYGLARWGLFPLSKEKPAGVNRRAAVRALTSPRLDATQRNLMRLTNVLVCGVSAKAENERSPPVGHRNVSDSIRRRDVGGWAVVYRKKVSQASGRPSRTNGVGPGDKPFANLPSVKSKISLLVRMHPDVRHRLPFFL